MGAIFADVVVLRPLGTVATVEGFGAFVASAPFAAASCRIGASWDLFFLAPAEYTVTRRLGDF